MMNTTYSSIAEVPESATFEMADYIRQHGLPAKATTAGIETLDCYVNTKDHTYHENAVVIPATWAAVREFLGY
jgi:hypothetical protein